jgi:hypothetical protein
MRRYNPLLLLVALSMLVMGGPAQAVTYVYGEAVFDFTTGTNVGIEDGNARIFKGTSSVYGDFFVRATGWSLETTPTGVFVRNSKLVVYSGGLGIISGDDQGGTSNQHTIDNSKRKDFVLFQFDSRVKLLHATFNTYSVLGATKDSDATLRYGDTDIPWNASLPLDDQPKSVLDAMFAGEFTSYGPSGSNSRDINQDGHWGDLWLIGADFNNTSTKVIDGFKITNLGVVPEPATWTMLIVGFGLMGAALRRSRALTTAAA